VGDRGRRLAGRVFVVVEAVLCFLPELEVRRALAQVAALAAGGPAGSEVALDTWGTWMRDHQDDHDALRVMDARVQWFCDSPAEIEAFGLGLRSAETVGLMDAPAELVDLLAPEDRAVFDAARHDPQASSYRLHRFGIGPPAQAGGQLGSS
jgi:O-methyltransferase involved in polyketide biosynthesis